MGLARGISLSSRALCRSTTANFLAPLTQAVPATTSSFSSMPVMFAQMSKEDAKAQREKIKRRRKKHKFYKLDNLKEMQQFTLCEAMRFIKCFEIGKSPNSSKYDVHVRLRTKKDGGVVRNQLRLPYPVKTDVRVAVICPPDSAAATKAREAGAALVGEEEIFEMIKAGKIEFDRCIAIPNSLQRMSKEGIPRILGPRGLMPNLKMGTVVANPGPAVKQMMGGTTYRERLGVVRMAVGRLSFTPEMLRDNIKAYITSVKKDAALISEQTAKEVYEVVLSSTNSPGFSLNGDFYKPGPGNATPQELAVM